jgi:hypothetical protein
VNNQKTKIKKGETQEMKKLIGIVLAIACVMALVLPIAVNADANVGSTATVAVNPGSGAPWMSALFMTPDDNNLYTDGTQVNPEPAIPNSISPLFPNTALGLNGDRTKDGWKRVVFYVAASDNTDPAGSTINGVNVTVNYPTSAGGAEKFQIDAQLNNGVWTASQSYFDLPNEKYPVVPAEGPNGVQAVVPPANGSFPSGWSVRVLTPAAAVIDINADGVLNDATTFGTSFLNSYDGNVVYGTNTAANTPLTVGNRFTANKLVVLELTGWIWYHEAPLTYTFSAFVQGSGGQSDTLNNSFTYVAAQSLYTDFTSISYNPSGTPLPTTNINVGVNGDNDLSTITPVPSTNAWTTDLPTVWDNGNADADLYIKASALVKDGTKGYADPNNISLYNIHKFLTNFDVTLDYKLANGTVGQIGTINYTGVADVDSNLANASWNLITTDGSQTPSTAVLLRSCHPAQIDFSLHSNVDALGNKINTDAGSYSGTIILKVGPYTGTYIPAN